MQHCKTIQHVHSDLKSLWHTFKALTFLRRPSSSHKKQQCFGNRLFPSLGPPRPQVHQFRYSANHHLISYQTRAKQTMLLSYSLISRWFCVKAFRSVTISSTLQGRSSSIYSVPALWTPCTNEVTYFFHYSLFTAEVLRQHVLGSNPRTGAPHAAT
jgi:hypothetical protein